MSSKEQKQARSLEEEIQAGEEGRLHQFMERFRQKMESHPALLLVYRCLVIGLGGLCLLAGLIMLVTPGPGWLFIFMGLGLWGTEFHWAHRLNIWAKAKVLGAWRSFQDWRAQRQAAKK